MKITNYLFLLTAALLAFGAVMIPAVPAFADNPSNPGISTMGTPGDNMTYGALPPPPGRPPRTWDNTYPPRPYTPHPTPPQPRVTWPRPGYNNWQGNYYGVNPDYYNPPTIIYQQQQPVYYVPVINSFSANPNYIEAGQTATLTWTVSNADTVTISPAVGSVPATGSFAVAPTYATTYTLVAANNQGTVSASTTVTVATYVVSAYGTGSAGSVPIAQGGEIPYSTPSTSSGSPIVTSGVSSAAAATVNPWLMYLLLLSLLAVAAGVIVYLLVRRPAMAHARAQAGSATAFLATSAAPAATTPATAVAGNTAIEAGLPAKFVSPAGTTMPITGKPLGRKDFQALTTPENAELISRQHMLVTYENSKYSIEDTGSTNGTRLNGSEIRGSGKHEIANGDTVELAGILKLTFKV